MKNGGDNSEKSQDGIVSGGASSRVSLGRKKILQLGVVVVAVVLLAAGWWLYQSQTTSDKEITYNKDSFEYQALLNAQNAPVPADNSGKATYYKQIATAYARLNDYEKALENTLKADSYLDEEMRADGRSFYLDIAFLYKQTGDKGKAREYYQKEIDRLNNSEFRDENVEVIKNLEKLKEQV